MSMLSCILSLELFISMVGMSNTPPFLITSEGDVGVFLPFSNPGQSGVSLSCTHSWRLKLWRQSHDSTGEQS